LFGATPEDIAFAGAQRAQVAPYIETQTWSPFRFNQIESISAPESRVALIQELLRRNNLSVPVNAFR
jgi:hypothetical protein